VIANRLSRATVPSLRIFDEHRGDFEQRVGLRIEAAVSTSITTAESRESACESDRASWVMRRRVLKPHATGSAGA